MGRALAIPILRSSMTGQVGSAACMTPSAGVAIRRINVVRSSSYENVTGDGGYGGGRVIIPSGRVQAQRYVRWRGSSACMGGIAAVAAVTGAAPPASKNLVHGQTR